MRHRDTEGRGDVKTEEAGVTLSQTKEHLGAPEAGRGREGLCSRDFGGSVAL